MCARARRLVLNGLTAEVAGGAGGGATPTADRDSYHELELFRQLLALPEPVDDGDTDNGTDDGGTDADDVEEATASDTEVVQPAAPPAHLDARLHQICAARRAGRVLLVVALPHRTVRDHSDQAQSVRALVGDAVRIRMAFASQLQPSAPLWSKEVGAGERGMVRAPDSLPGLAHHYPHGLSPAKCNILTTTGPASNSPTSSEESASPTELSSYRRLGGGGGGGCGGGGAPLMRRLALGFSGALLHPSDDDSTPLVADTPTTPTNLCISGGYINEASEAAARARDTASSNRAPRVPALPAPPAPPRNAPQDVDGEFNKCSNANSCASPPPTRSCTNVAGSRSTSSSGSSCGATSRCSGNNNARLEPELRQAPWFQHGIPREIALEVLAAQPVGAFLVRGSTSQPACFALSVRVPRDFQPRGIAHYLILRTAKGYKIKGFTKEFTSLCALVTHHSVMPELLPVPLRLARGGPPARRADHADIEQLATPVHVAHATHAVHAAHAAQATHPTLPARTYATQSTASPPPRRAPHSHHGTPHRTPAYRAQLDV